MYWKEKETSPSETHLRENFLEVKVVLAELLSIHFFSVFCLSVVLGISYKARQYRMSSGTVP